MSSPRAADSLRLATTSFTILFFELALIRYLPAYVKYFAYFTNFVLLGAFLGSGAGLLAARRVRALERLWPVLATALFAAVFLLRNVTVRVPRGGGEFLWGIYGSPSPGAVTLGIAPTVLLLFGLIAAAFVPLGARLGELFGRFRPLTAYGLDLGGALAGVAAFTLVSRTELPPWTWLSAVFAVELACGEPAWRRRIAVVAGAAASLALAVRTAEPGERWSPYYRITLAPGEQPGYEVVNVNGSLHQFIVDYADTSRSPIVRRVLYDYLRPYAYVNTVDTVLVVGSGTGNDVALLLALGAQWVDAVEIDPAIVELGRERHRARPYADPRVHVHVADARAFLRRTQRRYALIVFATLDSQTLLSGMTTVRLDNYVYTLEAFEEARARLRPDGRLITYHMSPYQYIAARIYQNVYHAFQAPSVSMHLDTALLYNSAFVAGVPRELVAARGVPAWLLQPTRQPTDDWPYLYVEHAGIPGHYLAALAGVLVLAALAVRLLAGGGLGREFDAAMFFLGAGFMLVETKSVTEMSLLFGSTWTVNVLVFSAVLVMLLAGNLAVQRGVSPSAGALVTALVASLALGALVPVRAIAGTHLLVQWVLGSILVALPLLFAAMLFPRLFAARRDPARALGWNLLGAVAGGTLEYASMALGIKALYLAAALMYLVAWAAALRGIRQQTVGGAGARWIGRE